MDQLHALIESELARRAALGQPCEVADVSGLRGKEYPGGVSVLTVQLTLRPVRLIQARPIPAEKP